MNSDLLDFLDSMCNLDNNQAEPEPSGTEEDVKKKSEEELSLDDDLEKLNLDEAVEGTDAHDAVVMDDDEDDIDEDELLKDD